MNEEVENFLSHFGKKGQKWGVVKATPSRGRTLKDRADSAKDNTLKNKVARSKNPTQKENTNLKTSNTLKNKVKASRVKAGDKVYLDKKQTVELVKKELNVRPGKKGLTRSGNPKGLLLKTKVKNSRDLAFLNELSKQQGATLRRRVKKANKVLGKKKYSTINISEPTVIYGKKFIADYNLKINTRTGEIEQTAMNNKGEVFLEHFGKKGQKWGVRKASATDSGGTNAAPKATAPKATAPKAETKVKKAGKYTKADKLSNKQLKESVDRMRLEKDYNALVADKKSKSTGRRLLGKTLKTTEDIAFNTLDVQGKRVANALIGKELDKTLGIESSILTTAKEFVKGEKVKASAKREAEALVKKQNAPRSFIPPTGNSRKPPKGARKFKP